jgi:hypothetical protein
MKKIDTLETCVYCGAQNPETKDHVPPKGIFPPPRPSNLITVPCCSKCHDGTSKDDEYFRDMIALRDDVHNHPKIQNIIPKIMKSLAKPAKQKYATSLLTGTKTKRLITPNGLYVGNGIFFDVEISRLDKVVERTVKGLFWHEKKIAYPVNGIVKSYYTDYLKNLDDDFIEEMAKYFNNSIYREIGDGILKYYMAKGDDDFNEIWIMNFFDKVVFLVFLIYKNTA